MEKTTFQTYVGVKRIQAEPQEKDGKPGYHVVYEDGEGEKGMSESIRGPVGHAVAMKAGAMLDEAIQKKDWPILEKFRAYVRELQTDRAPWLARTLDKLNIPAKEIRFCECVQPKSPKGA